jgi:DNA replication protein DnaC
MTDHSLPFEAARAPQPSADMESLSALAAKLAALYGHPDRPDDAMLQEERRRLGSAYATCVCLGRGGTGEVLVVAATGHNGVRLPATDVHGRDITTWTQICPCPDGQAHRVMVERARRDSTDRYRQRRIARIAGAAGIPRMYEGLTTASWYVAADEAGARPDEVATVGQGLYFWEELVEEGSPRCLLLLVGNNGTGKSGLAAGIAQDWVGRERSVLYRRSVQITAELRAAPYRRDREDDTRPTEIELLAAYQECDLLVLDDLGAEADDPRVVERMFAILDARLQECKATIVTTNLPEAALAERLGERLADRLYSKTCAVQVILVTPNLRASV